MTAPALTQVRGSLIATLAVDSRARSLPVPAGADPASLLRGCATKLVFSSQEQRLCGQRRDLTGWAGRLAAKLAVAELLGVDGDGALDTGRDIGLAQIQILPERQEFCAQGAGCLQPHPPHVLFGDRFAALLGGGHVNVSISHTRRRAIALAVRVGERSVSER